MVSYLSQHGKPGDTILCTGLTRPTFEYYLKPKGFVFASFPQDMADHLAHLNEKWYIDNTDLITESKKCLNEGWDSLKTGQTLWIIASQRKINQSLLQEIKILWPGSSPIQTPRMALRKLGEPLCILKIPKES